MPHLKSKIFFFFYFVIECDILNLFLFFRKCLSTKHLTVDVIQYIGFNVFKVKLK